MLTERSNVQRLAGQLPSDIGKMNLVKRVDKLIELGSSYDAKK